MGFCGIAVMKERTAMQCKNIHECAACNDTLTVVAGKTAIVYVVRTKITTLLTSSLSAASTMCHGSDG